MFHPNNLGLVGYPEKVSTDNAPWFLVFSGATSVGMFAIQLAHLSGYRVVTTASPKNFDLVKSLGADAVVDYRDADVSHKIKEITGNTLSHALDTFATTETQEASVKAFGPGKGKLITILPAQASARALRDDIEVKGVCAFHRHFLITDLLPRRHAAIYRHRESFCHFLWLGDARLPGGPPAGCWLDAQDYRAGK
jgi:NADPH:quinone reductase-like Zn-dependent oxidoreductase